MIAVYFLKKKGAPVYPVNNDLAMKTCHMIMILGSIPYLLYFITVELLPISKVQVLFQSSSLWLPILGNIILGQKLSYKAIILCPVSFFGLVLIVDPSMLGISVSNSVSEIYDFSYYFGCFLGAASGILIALKRVFTIHGMKEIDTWHNLFYFSLGGSILATFCNIYFGFNSMITLWDAYLVIQITAFGVFWHGGMVYFLRLESNANINGIILN